MNKLFKIFFILTTIGIYGLYSISSNQDNNYKIYTDIKKVPHKKAAIVLGTSKYVKKGKKNFYYVYRIKAAAQLWKAKKVDAIIVSGDSSKKYYDETKNMFKDLVKQGVPARYITKDPYGVRTFDSIIRAKEVLDLDDYIVVSQKFHLKRALYIAKQKGHKAIGFAAKQFENTDSFKKMEERESLAMVKAFLDLNVLDTKPRFESKKIKVTYKKR